MGDWDPVDQSGWTPKVKRDPTEGMSGLQKFAAGVGGAFTRMYEGPQQLFYQGMGALAGPENTLSSEITGDHRNSWQKRADDLAARVTAERETDAPLNRTRAGMAGNIAGNILPAVVIPGEGLLANAASGAALSAVQPLGTGEGWGDRLINTAMGAAGGAGGTLINKGLQRIAQPIVSHLTPTAQQAVQTLQNAGVPLDLAQRTGSAMLGKIKSGLSSLPITSQWAHANAEAQKRATTAALLRTIGADGDRASPEVMGSAKAAIGDVFNQQAKKGVTIDDQLLSDLAHVEGRLTQTVPQSSHGPIKAQINDILSAEKGGQVNGSIIQRVNSDLGNMTRNPDYGSVAGDMRSAIASALQRQGTPEEAAALSQARIQYRNLKQIEGAITPDENISSRKLANSLINQKRNRAQGIYGQGDQEVPNLARSASQILPESVGNSGTADRHAAMGMLTAPAAIAAPFALAGYHDLKGDNESKGAWSQAARRSALIASALLSAKAGQKLFQWKPVANYLSEGFGGAADSNMGAKIARQLLQAGQQRRIGAAINQLPVGYRLAITSDSGS